MKSLKPSVYIETTVASYLTARPTRDLIMMARQQSSEIWWQRRLPEFSPVISQLVLDEAGRGDPEAARRRLRVLRDFPILEVTAAAFRLAAQFVRPEAMPDNAKDDALHVALCAIHGISYLLTWNFRHIANAEIRRVLAGICTEAGYGLPTICTRSAP
jgi:predicted nucleic acid-binding protein